MSGRLSIAVFAALVLAFALVSSTSQAMNGNKPDKATLGKLICTTNQIAKWDGSAWVCAADQDTLSPSREVVVIDGIGQEIGAFLELESAGNLSDREAFVLYRSDPTVPFFAVHPLVVLKLQTQRFIGGGDNIAFTLPGCDGVPYLEHVGEFPGLSQKYFDLFLVPVEEDPQLGPIAYVPVDPDQTPEPGPIPIWSSLNLGNGPSCSTFGAVQNIPDLVRVEPVELGFVLPYGLSD